MIEDDESADVKALLRDAGQTFEPSEERVRASREAIAIRLGAAAAGAAAVTAVKTASASSASGAAAAGAAASTSSVVYWIGAGVLATVIAGGVYVATREPTPETRPTATSTTQKHVMATSAPEVMAPASAAQKGSVAEPAVQAGAAPARAEPTPRPQGTAVDDRDVHEARAPKAVQRKLDPSAVQRPSAQRSAAQPAVTLSARQTPEPTEPEPAQLDAPRLDVDPLAREMELLQGARAALQAGQARESLTLLDRHAALFPRATLRQEALATRVLALCQIGRTVEARRAAAQLARLAPRSAHLIGVASSCAFQDESSRTDAHNPASK